MIKSRIQYFKENKIGNDYVVGDLHGYYSLLMRSLNKFDFDFDKDRLFSVGDLIDRGPENQDCLELIYEKWFFPVLGNHEVLFLRAIMLGEFSLWYRNGGDWFEKEKENYDLFAQYADDINALLPLAIEIKNGKNKIGIIHAEPFPDWNLVGDYLKEGFDLENLTYLDVYKNNIFWYNMQKTIMV